MCTIISQDNPSFYGGRKILFSLSTTYVVLSSKQLKELPYWMRLQVLRGFNNKKYVSTQYTK